MATDVGLGVAAGSVECGGGAGKAGAAGLEGVTCSGWGCASSDHTLTMVSLRTSGAEAGRFGEACAMGKDAGTGGGCGTSGAGTAGSGVEATGALAAVGGTVAGSSAEVEGTVAGASVEVDGTVGGANSTS